MSRVHAPADRRFRRVHVKPARKRGRWALLARPLLTYGVLAAAAAYVVYRGGALLAHARMLQIGNIVVRGNSRLSNGEVLAILSGLRGENIVLTDLDQWRGRLMSSPWVEDAALRRALPSTVEVFVTERAPIALGRLDGELFLIDERGVVIDHHSPRYGDLDLPIVDGLAEAEGKDARGELAARLLLSLQADPEVARQVSQLDVTDLHNAAVILNGDPAVIYVGTDRFLQRLTSYLQLASALRERVPAIDSVDLRFDDRIYVRPAGRSAAIAVARERR
jgi:cell division protein FtsQ